MSYLKDFKRWCQMYESNNSHLIVEQEIKQGAAGDPYQYKKEGDRYFYAKKKEGATASWIERADKDGHDAIQSKIFGEPAGSIGSSANQTKEIAKLATTVIDTKLVTTVIDTKRGNPIVDHKNIVVGTEFITYPPNYDVVGGQVKKPDIRCKVIKVEDNVLIGKEVENEESATKKKKGLFRSKKSKQDDGPKAEGTLYKLVKAVNMQNDKEFAGGLTYNGEEGWIAFYYYTPGEGHNKYMGILRKPTAEDPEGYWSWDWTHGSPDRENAYSIFTPQV
ncbi:hypothetical protein UFOVP972_178 [uncultured Caudovirales phage]|uniref:Uncharacterized protein n=1 Tax=uncultured Caudovirales phage TaxID=2100421 RepID=A0A6J5PUF4_9CAUD|nr:hypothetical protein UFOVP972_178 [uncultured Caudovirales phage]